MSNITDAIESYARLTDGCVRFRPKTDDDVDYVYFTSASGGCFSSVGKVGGPQAINYEVRKRSII